MNIGWVEEIFDQIYEEVVVREAAIVERNLRLKQYACSICRKELTEDANLSFEYVTKMNHKFASICRNCSITIDNSHFSDRLCELMGYLEKQKIAEEMRNL